MKSFLLLFLLPTNIYAVTHLSITGSSTIAPLIRDLSKNFEKDHKNIEIEVQTGGSTRGLVDVSYKRSPLGMVSRSLKKQEIEKYKVKPHLIAYDGIALITHKSNPITNLTSEQIKSIYTGKINNWKQLGGKDKKIVKVHKASGRSTQKLFLEYFQLKNKQVTADIIIGDNEQGIKTVSVTPESIGYVSIGSAEYNIKNNVAIKFVQLNGITPSTETITKGQFPIIRELNIVTKDPMTKETANFLSFLMDKKNHSFIKKHYFVPASH